MKIQVTQEDINTAKARLAEHGCARSRNCPVAIAAQRATGAEYACVDGEGVWIAYVDESGTHSGPFRILPPDVRLFINRFDADKEVAPLEFDVDDLLHWSPTPRGETT